MLHFFYVKLTTTLTTLSEGLRATVLRFPAPTLFAAITTALLALSIDDGFDDSMFFRSAFLSGLGFIASLLSDLIAEARGGSGRARFAGQAFAIVLLILYSSFSMPEVLDNAAPPFWYRYFILLFCLHLAIALVPTLAVGGFALLWRFNLSCFLRYFFSTVNAALLFVGLALALLSVDKLFELDIADEFYPQVWVICAFFAHPLLFLGGLPRLSELKDDCDFPKALRFSLLFIGLPLVALYLVILYAYIAKIGIQWSWPNGWVAMPIFLLAVISLLTFLLSLPLPKTENWARVYHHWLFRLLLPLSIVLFMALQVRLSDYGMTINRYLGLALAVWLFGISLTYILRPALKVGWMPFSLLIVALFSIHAGSMGAFSWSERAQVERVRSMAAQMSVAKNGIFLPTSEAQEKGTVEDFKSALRYVLRNFGPRPLETELSQFFEDRKIKIDYRRSDYFVTNQIIQYLDLDDDLKENSSYYRLSNNALQTYGHDWMVDYNVYLSGSRERIDSYKLGDIKLQIRQSKNQLEIMQEERVLIRIDTTEWVTAIEEAILAEGTNQSEPLVWNREADDWRFSFVLSNARIDTKKHRLQNLGLSIFISPPR
jgi:hypothetical protein